MEDGESGTSDSGDWKPKKTWYNSHTSSRKAGRLHNFGKILRGQKIFIMSVS